MNKVIEILEVKTRNKTEETIYETYKRELCTRCKNKRNKEDLCNIRITQDNKARCINYDRCMRNKCKTCKEANKCNQ